MRLRSGAGTNYSILGTYNNGTPLTITGTSGNWTAVTINGVKGYVNSAYVTTTKSDGGSKPSGSIGETIVATAKQYMGAPYVYGGMSPSGFDCSGPSFTEPKREQAMQTTKTIYSVAASR